MRIREVDGKTYINDLEVVGVTSFRLINILANNGAKFVGIRPAKHNHSKGLLYFERTNLTDRLIKEYTDNSDTSQGIYKTSNQENYNDERRQK